MKTIVSVPNFSLNRQFWCFEPNFPKKGISGCKIEPVSVSTAVTYYIKLLHTGGDRHNGILMSLLLLVAETIKITTANIKPTKVLFRTFLRVTLSCKSFIKAYLGMK